MAEQLAFQLSSKPALGRDDFFVSPANALAVKALEDHKTWPQGKLVLAGPTASGKTHLAYVWAGEAEAQIIKAADLNSFDIAQLATGPMVVEDIDFLPKTGETALFHLHNLMLAEGHALLMTTATAPTQMPTELPDLKSRLQGTSVVALEAPDDALLGAVLLKLFADRQINPPGGLLDFILPRIERSFAALRHFVDTLDRRALAEKRPIGQGLAREILNEASGTNLDKSP